MAKTVKSVISVYLLRALSNANCYSIHINTISPMLFQHSASTAVLKCIFLDIELFKKWNWLHFHGLASVSLQHHM